MSSAGRVLRHCKSIRGAGQVGERNYVDARDKLESVLRKTDGCAMSGAPDPNDWIEDCAAQAEVYPLIVDAIALIDEILGG
jgi:hypothetical protein